MAVILLHIDFLFCMYNCIRYTKYKSCTHAWVSHTCSGLLLSGGALNHFTSGLMTSVISLGLLQQHIQESRDINKVTVYTADGVHSCSLKGIGSRYKQ